MDKFLSKLPIILEFNVINKTVVYQKSRVYFFMLNIKNMGIFNIGGIRLSGLHIDCHTKMHQ
jgi:hypothetical protein